jgi:hypothetical protein
MQKTIAKRKDSVVEPITRRDMVLASFLRSALIAVMSHRDEMEQSDEYYLEQSAFMGLEMFSSWERLCKEQRTIGEFEQKTKTNYE